MAASEKSTRSYDSTRSRKRTASGSTSDVPTKEEVRKAFAKYSSTREREALEVLAASKLKPRQVRSIKTETNEPPSGWTLLHMACRKGWFDAVKILVEKYECKAAGVKNDDGQTPLMLACKEGHSQIVEYLVSKCNCKPEQDESRDDDLPLTPFQAACMTGRLQVVDILVQNCDCDPLRKDKSGETPLIDAVRNNKIEVIEYLKSAGKVTKTHVDEAVQYVLMKKIEVLRQDHPFRPAYKVCVIGNQTAGKSTLVKALEGRLSTSGTMHNVTDRFKKVRGVELKTAGIVPVHVPHAHSHGQIIIYDFAGQHVYYASHSAYLENVASSQGVLFLLVVDISKSKEEIQRVLYYWSSFISNITSHSHVQPQVKVIGSHADVAKNESKTALNEVCNKLDCMLGTSWKENTHFLDCTKSASGPLGNVCDYIQKSSQIFFDGVTVDVQVHSIYGVIKGSHLSLKVACKVQDIVELIHAEENSRYLADDLLPSDIKILSQHLSTLSKHGLILYLKDDEDIGESWVIFDKGMLLSEVNGTIFAPKDFKEYHHGGISINTGVISLTEIKRIFRLHDAQMIISLLTHLKFCHKVEEAEALLIDQRSPKQDENQSESYYFFPGLINEELPEESCRSIERTYYRFGWCLE